MNDSIYQFSENYVKIITDGDYAKVALLDSVTVTNPVNHIIVASNAEFVLGYFKNVTAPAAPCFNVWDRSNTGTANNKCVELKVHFEQSPTGIYNKTTCTVGLVIIKRKVLGIWFNAKPNYITLDGAFGGPRSPFNNVTGLSGYHQPNPFSINYSSEVNHYTDFSYQYESCYTMTAGTYKMYADFNGGGVATTVNW